MTREEYCAIPALNFSRAKHLLKSAAHFKAAWDEEKEETEAQRVGTLVHAMVLEGKNMLDLYAIKPEGMSFATKEGKAWKKEQTKQILESDSAKMVPAVADAIAANPAARAFINGCKLREHGVVGNLHGVRCKALLDMAGSDGGMWALGDLKTAVDASPEAFAKIAYSNHYDMQLAWYSDLLAMVEGLEEPPYAAWLAAEKSAPWFNAVYQPPEEMMESGRRKVEAALTLYKECQESGQWPFKVRGISTLKMPGWAVRQEEEARPDNHPLR